MLEKLSEGRVPGHVWETEGYFEKATCGFEQKETEIVSSRKYLFLKGADDGSAFALLIKVQR